MKKNAVEVAEFIDGEYVFLNKKPKTNKGIAVAGVASLSLIPQMVFAADLDGTFGNVHSAVMNAVDAGVVFVIIFAGASWALGHRSKALEIMMGVSCGYIIIRNAVAIRDFLQTI